MAMVFHVDDGLEIYTPAFHSRGQTAESDSII